ncbi:MAG: hypothetical protein QME96_05645 [Myxococcota bacterium]|nr:hypothetical protein [Myxococcota bacterium]
MNGARQSRFVAVDTRVLRGANAPIDTRAPKPGSIFAARHRLLRRIVEGNYVVLVSRRLLGEYREQIPRPLGDFVTAFFALLGTPARWRCNWQRRWRGERAAARQCRFPPHDDHVLRTAIRKDGAESTLFAEEPALPAADACIHRRFAVHILPPD